MPIQQQGFTFDALTQLKDAGLVAASGAAQVGGQAKVVDLGLGRIDGRIIVDVSACEADTGDEQYIVIAQVSNAADFSASKFSAGAILLGDSTKTQESADTAVPRRQELMFTNEINGTLYRYLRIYTVVAGTIATGVNFTAELVQDF